jgi:hypothetical protein
MSYGFMIEKRISAKDVEALNRTAVADADIDGGALVSLGAFADGRFTATKATAGTGLWMAYNPSEHFTKVGDKFFAGFSKDPRDYTNLATRSFDVFKPQVGDIVGLTDGNLAASQTVAVDKYLEQGANGYTVKDAATTATTSLKVIAIENLPFPQAGIGMENAKLYVCEVAQN